MRILAKVFMKNKNGGYNCILIFTPDRRSERFSVRMELLTANAVITPYGAFRASLRS